MSEAQQIFQELLYGEGAWIGLILTLSIIILVSSKVKESSVFFIPLTIFMGISYLDNVAVSSNFMWCAILMFLCTPYLIWRLASR